MRDEYNFCKNHGIGNTKDKIRYKTSWQPVTKCRVQEVNLLSYRARRLTFLPSVPLGASPRLFRFKYNGGRGGSYIMLYYLLSKINNSKGSIQIYIQIITIYNCN